jgi:acyl dehydratase
VEGDLLAATREAAQGTYGKITDEGIERMRQRIGVVVPQLKPFNVEASIDGMSHFVNGYGDDNPLFWDEDYRKSTRWGSIIGAPLYYTTMGVSEIKTLRPEVRARGVHALQGVHELFSGDEWEWFLPLMPGDRLTKRYYLYSVEEKPTSSLSGGRSVICRYRADYINQHGKLAAVDRYYFVRVEREGAQKVRRHASIDTRWTDEQIEELDAAYASEVPARGSEVRYWEDVRVGERMPRLLKGPLTATDVIAWMRGWGGGVNSNRLAWKQRQHEPKFFTRNESNAWDVVERLHWDNAAARIVGNPAAYDFGRMRSAFMSHLVTDWMGDAAWLWRLKTEFRSFAFLGDIQWVEGVVADKSVKDGHHIVDLELSCKNQRGEINAPGSARVILPSRTGGAARLPEPDSVDNVPLIY